MVRWPTLRPARSIAFNGGLEAAFTPCNNGDICVPDVIDFVNFIPGGFSTDFASSLTPVSLQNPHPGPARNLVVEELPEHGGYVPGLVIVNNTIYDGGIGGIEVSGSSRPFEIVPQRSPLYSTSGSPGLPVGDDGELHCRRHGQRRQSVDRHRFRTDGDVRIRGHVGFRQRQQPLGHHRQLDGLRRWLGRRQYPDLLPPHGTDLQFGPPSDPHGSAADARLYPARNGDRHQGRDRLQPAGVERHDDGRRSQVSFARHPGGDDVFQIHGLPGPVRGRGDAAVYLENVTSVDEGGAGGCTYQRARSRAASCLSTGSCPWLMARNRLHG